MLAKKIRTFIGLQLIVLSSTLVAIQDQQVPTSTVNHEAGMCPTKTRANPPFGPFLTPGVQVFLNAEFFLQQQYDY